MATEQVRNQAQEIIEEIKELKKKIDQLNKSTKEMPGTNNMSEDLIVANERRSQIEVTLDPMVRDNWPQIQHSHKDSHREVDLIE